MHLPNVCEFKCSLLANMVPPITSVIWYPMTVGSVAGHIPLNWSQFHLLMCLYVEKISAMCGTWVWTWLFWILVNFWCATDVLLHPICDLWAFHKLHFINESSDLSPTAWSMCSGLKYLIASGLCHRPNTRIPPHHFLPVAIGKLEKLRFRSNTATR